MLSSRMLTLGLGLPIFPRPRWHMRSPGASQLFGLPEVGTRRPKLRDGLEDLMTISLPRPFIIPMTSGEEFYILPSFDTPGIREQRKSRFNYIPSCLTPGKVRASIT